MTDQEHAVAFWIASLWERHAVRSIRLLRRGVINEARMLRAARAHDQFFGRAAKLFDEVAVRRRAQLAGCGCRGCLDEWAGEAFARAPAPNFPEKTTGA